MSVQITLIGLGRIGASVGLALADHTDQLVRTGHDRDFGAARQAKKAGAVDHVALNLPNSVRKADIVLLAIPADQVKPTLELISQDLKEDVVVMDTAPLTQAGFTWAREILPPKRHYLHLTPMLNAAHLLQTAAGHEAAQADLFQSGMMSIIGAPGTPTAAIELAINLSQLLGSKPFFPDAAEIDGLLAGLHLLPQISAAGLSHALINQPGWAEGRKVAGRSFALETLLLSAGDGAEALSQAAMLNRKNLLIRLDQFIQSLQSFRQFLADEDQESVSAFLEQAADQREVWWGQRMRGNWEDEGVQPTFPSTGEIFGQLVGLGRKKKDD